MNEAATLLARISKFPNVFAVAAVLMVLSTAMLWLVGVDRTVVLLVAGVATLDALLWLTFSALGNRGAKDDDRGAPPAP